MRSNQFIVALVFAISFGALAGCDPAIAVSRSVMVPAPLPPYVVKTALSEVVGENNVEYHRIEKDEFIRMHGHDLKPPFDAYLFRSANSEHVGKLCVGVNAGDGQTFLCIYSARIGWRVDSKFLAVRPVMDRIEARLHFYEPKVPALRNWTETVLDQGRQRSTIPGEPYCAE